jgi:uncharacterized membrane protein
MIPYSSAVTIVVEPRRQFRLWMPWLLVWVLLLPFFLLLTPIVFAACLAYKVDPFQGVSIYWQLFNGLRGVRVEVEDRGARIRIV